MITFDQAIEVRLMDQPFSYHDWGGVIVRTQFLRLYKRHIGGKMILINRYFYQTVTINHPPDNNFVGILFNVQLRCWLIKAIL